MNAHLTRLLVASIMLFEAVACLDATALDAVPLAFETDGSEERAAASEVAVDAQPARSAPRCTLAPSCRPVRTFAFQLEACCSETLACGLELGGFAAQGLPPEIADQVFPRDLAPGDGCRRPGVMFVPVPGAEAQRVPVKDQPDILITPECDTYNFFSFPMPGCCLPSGQCGMSSHLSLSNIVPFMAPGSEMEIPQCLSGPEFNRQLQGTPIERLGDAPDIAKRCDYRALDARLLPVAPPNA